MKRLMSLSDFENNKIPLNFVEVRGSDSLILTLPGLDSSPNAEFDKTWTRKLGINAGSMHYFRDDDKNHSLGEALLRVDDAYTFFKDNHGIKNFYIIGSSFGGGVAIYFAGLRKSSGDMKGLLLRSPVVNFRTYFNRNYGFREGRLVENGTGRISFPTEVYKEAKKLGIPDITEIPTKIAHGLNDDINPIEEVRQFALENKLESIIEIPDGGHRLLGQEMLYQNRFESFIRGLLG